MAHLPTGTVTFLFTDIEGSTKRWELYPQQMQAALLRHNSLLHEAITRHGGYIFKTIGDAFCASFPTAPDALSAALQAQRDLYTKEWSESGAIRVRMALHTGIAEEWEGDYFGPTVNRVARLLSAGHGGQTLLSLPTYELVRDHLPAGVELRDMGERRLKDLIRPEHIYEMAVQGLPSEFPPLKTLDARPNNLPAQPTPLIGREKELQEAATLLRRSDVRLLTFSGPGGTGKTRLALQLAADMVDEFEAGAIFVNLAPLNDHTLVVSTIAQTLGAKESEGQPLLETLKAHLKDKEMLLVLDNLEQVLGAARDISELLLAAPGLKILATSRELLRVREERNFPIPPLTLPDLMRLPPLEHLTQYESVRLFIDRAVAAQPDFAVNNSNAPAVAEICYRLDGLPLAIELAAARVRILPPQAMLSRLESRLKLLIRGAPDLPARQQTLRGTIEWSYDLLTEEEKKLFSRLAVFMGGRTLEAIETVCNDNADMGIDLLDGVQSLVDKSLLRQEVGAGDEPRFVMLETIHEYAREKLAESGEVETARLCRNHAHYFAELAEQAAREIRSGTSPAEWQVRLHEEQANFRAALQWSFDQSDFSTVGWLVVNLERYWTRVGAKNEAKTWLRSILKHEAQLPTDLRAHVYKAAGNVGGGDGRSNLELMKESLKLHEEAGDAHNIALVLNNLGNLTRYHGDGTESEAYLERSLAIIRELGSRNPADWIQLLNLAGVAINRGDYERARALSEEFLEIARRHGNQLLIATGLSSLAEAMMLLRQPARAIALMEESTAISREFGALASLALKLLQMGEVARLAGEYQAAVGFYEESLELYRTLSGEDNLVWCLHNLGHARLRLGDIGQAQVVMRESLEQARRDGDTECFAAGLAGLAGTAAMKGDGQRAARLFGRASAELQLPGKQLERVDQMEFDHNLAAARTLLDSTAWEHAWAEGQAMSMEEAITYALEDPVDD